MNHYFSLESVQIWQQAEAVTAPGEQGPQSALESGAQGKVLLGVQTNLTLKVWAGFFVWSVVCFSTDVCTKQQMCKKTPSKHDLQIASAFASNQSHLLITAVLSSVELKNEACRLQKQGAEGTKKVAR